MQAIVLIDKLSMEYVRIKATPEMTPSDLLKLYNEAFTELYPQLMSKKAPEPPRS